jgi:hypothetical protein
MMVVHIASDAFVGTVAQAITVNINLQLLVAIYLVAMGQ